MSWEHCPQLIATSWLDLYQCAILVVTGSSAFDSQIAVLGWHEQISDLPVLCQRIVSADS